MIPKSIISRFKNKLTFAYKPAAITNKNVTLCFIPGFRSDFESSKKSSLVYEYAQEHGLGFLAWNHGETGSVVDWCRDGLELVQSCQLKDHYYIGASMGLWISLVLAEKTSPKGILGIGGGVDFTERWLKEVNVFDRNYIWRRPSAYDVKGYYEIPVSFLIDSRPALINKVKLVDCPVYLIHGSLDTDVTIEHARELSHYLSSFVATVSLDEISDGDHRLSRSQDLESIRHKIKLMMD
ncbi:Alpha/Beta hydrolase protein [Mucor mucedo]|uniref:Alpha/Beta hydrolase protein n=1 Tax=Mucor mucedo TaxID=29922 RepID=UPI0022208152|nr:Alpha/Beta hydrolase protein [Mucor mucedo]KAI7895991.1 Alpha/Beta hydrolase protein [Mucor mucedo]